MNKAVAIPYIIALVIGIIVLALLVYVFIKTSSSPALSFQECRSRWVEWCTLCKNTNWDEHFATPDYVKECNEIVAKELGIDKSWLDDNVNCKVDGTPSDCCAWFIRC